MSLIAYWKLDDDSNTNFVDQVSGGVSIGTGVTGNQPGIGDGLTSVYFAAPSNHNINIYSVMNASGFDPDEGSAVLWFKPDSGFWLASTYRFFLNISSTATSPTERIWLQKGYTQPRLSWVRQPNGAINWDSPELTSWQIIGYSWSIANSRIRTYWNGVAGSTFGTVTAWINPLDSTLCWIGAQSSTLNEMLGWIAHVAIWDHELTPREMWRLSQV